MSPPPRRIPIDAGAISREIVLENDAVVGSVNANDSHYQAATNVLARADPAWLRRLISRRVPLEHAATAFEHHTDDIKVVIELQDSR